MDLAEIKKTPISRKKITRIGRGTGSGKGKTCGKGMKGQNCRSGTGRHSAFEGGTMPLYRRLPKRGFTNARFKENWIVVNIDQLDDFKKGSEVSYKTLVKAGILKFHKGTRDLKLKILGKGTLKVEKLKFKAHKFSKSAQESIEKSSGKLEIIKPSKSTKKKSRRTK